MTVSFISKLFTINRRLTSDDLDRAVPGPNAKTNSLFGLNANKCACVIAYQVSIQQCNKGPNQNLICIVVATYVHQCDFQLPIITNLIEVESNRNWMVNILINIKGFL